MDESGKVAISTFEVDCAVSAKGEVNVSWKMRFEIPTEELDSRDLKTRMVLCRSVVLDEAMKARTEYILRLEEAKAAPAVSRSYPQSRVVDLGLSWLAKQIAGADMTGEPIDSAAVESIALGDRYIVGEGSPLDDMSFHVYDDRTEEYAGHFASLVDAERFAAAANTGKLEVFR